jgi:putative hydrolase of the HAD superfamily
VSKPRRGDVPDAVLFDLDGTLCERTQDVRPVYDAAFERAGVERFGSLTELWGAIDGPPDPNDYVGQLAAGFARLAAKRNRRVDTLALATAFRAGLDYTQVSYLPEAEAVLARAAEASSVGIVTNGPSDRQVVKLAALGLDGIEPTVCAGDMARRKPHVDPFERALAELGVPAERALYVGNSLEYDVAGAHNAGLRSAWLDDGDGPGDYHPDHVLDSLADLLPILG